MLLATPYLVYTVDIDPLLSRRNEPHIRCDASVNR